MKPNIEDTKMTPNGVIDAQANTHLFAFRDATKQSGHKDEPQKLDIQLKK